MASYPLPPWLNPSAAQGWGELSQRAAQIGLENQMQRDRLSAQQQQFAQESQQASQEAAQKNALAQQQLDYDHQLEQQKIAIDQAYKQQNLSLSALDTQTAQGRLDLANRQFQDETNQAAKKFTANQQFQKAMLPADQGGEGLTASQAALKYMSPYMGGTEVGRLAGLDLPAFKPGVPLDIQGVQGKKLVETSNGHFQVVDTGNAGANISSVPAKDENGNVIGHWVFNPVTGKAELIRNTKTSGLEATKQAVDDRVKALQGGASTTVDKPKALGKDEVIRIVQGRRAVFDSKTKQFIRWEDDKEPANAD